MAIRHSCDVCGEIVEPYFTYGNTITIPMMLELEENKRQKLKTSKTIDLCKPCMLKLRAFLGLESHDRIDEGG